MYLGEIVRSILVALIDATPKPLLFSGYSSPVFNKQYGFDTSIMSSIEEAWIGSDSSRDAFVHPAFTADFKQEDLSPKVVAKLESIRQIIVHQAEVVEDFVSLRDAAVSDFYFLLFFFLGLNSANQIVRWVSSLVARRAALLSGVAIAGVLIQQGYASLIGENNPVRNQNDQLRIGVDGRYVLVYLFPKHSSQTTFLFKHSLVEHYPNFIKTLRESLRKLVGEDVESRVEIGLAKDGSGVGGKTLAVPHSCY